VSRIVVVIPLKSGTHERVRSILHNGPAFDPESAGLERHHVFLTEHEVVFLFEGTTPGDLEALAADAKVWSAASEWAEVAAASPRVADDVYDWIRLEPPENVVYTPTPGPGDSEGGDLYAP
jgi:hypothetical protein